MGRKTSPDPNLTRHPIAGGLRSAETFLECIPMSGLRLLYLVLLAHHMHAARQVLTVLAVHESKYVLAR